MTDHSHPDTQRWRLFLDDQLEDDVAQQLSEHLESCAQCQKTLEGLAAGHQTWAGMAKLQHTADNGASSEHLQDVIDELKEGVEPEAAARTPTPESLTFLEPGEQEDSIGRLAHYEILEIVGSGGMGVVMKAWDTSLRRVVAIKVLGSHLALSATARRRFVREAQAAAAVSHDHIVAIHAVESEHEPPFLVMQYIEGRTLQERIDATGPMEVREILRIGEQTARGLAAAHQQGIVHRDIKPANILLENGVERVRITDFGLARAVDDAAMTQSGVVAGTPLFMAPEQAQGEPVDQRSDLFSLGSVLYAMSTGRPPFRSSTMMGVIRRVCEDTPRSVHELNPDIPDWLCGIIERLLDKDPEARPQSASELAETLSRCLAHLQRPQSTPLPPGLLTDAATPGETVETRRERQTEAHRQPEVSPNSPEIVAETIHSPADQEAARRVRWPGGLLMFCGMLNLIVLLPSAIITLSWAPQGVQPQVSPPGQAESMLLSMIGIAYAGLSTLTIVGGYRLRRLENRSIAVAGAVSALFTFSGFFLGWIAGIWALVVLTDDSISDAFHRKARRASDDPPLPARILLARVLVLLIASVLLLAGPCILLELARYRPGDWLPTPLMFAVVAVAVLALRMLCYTAFGDWRAAPQLPLRQRLHQALISPGLLAGFLVWGVAITMNLADMMADQYSGWLERATTIITPIAVVALLVVWRAEVRRHREGRPRYQPASGGLILILFLVVFGGLRGLVVYSLGYLHMDIDDPNASVYLKRVGDGYGVRANAGDDRIRIPPGEYTWSVIDPGVWSDSHSHGTVSVQRGKLSSIETSTLDSSYHRLAGYWKLIERTVRLSPDDTTVGIGWDDGFSEPQYMSISGDGMLTWFYEESGRALDLKLTLTVDQFRKKVRLVENDSDRVRATGLWAAGQQRMLMVLQPGEVEAPVSILSTPAGTYASLQFERMPDEEVQNLIEPLMGGEAMGGD